MANETGNYELAGREYWPKFGLPRLILGAKLAAGIMALGLVFHSGKLIGNELSVERAQAVMQTYNSAYLDQLKAKSEQELYASEGFMVGTFGFLALSGLASAAKDILNASDKNKSNTN